MSFVSDVRSKIRKVFTRSNVTLDLHDIQATVLRERPEPYFGTHVLLRVDDPKGGRDLLKRLVPHVSSAESWWEEDSAWIAVALSYAGIEALGAPKATLDSFPVAFREGMKARAEHLRDTGINAPDGWDAPYGSGDVHIALSIFAADEARWREKLAEAKKQFESLSGVTLLGTHDFGAQPGSRNPFGYKDLISNPAIQGSGVDPLPGQGPALPAGEFILGYPSASGELLAAPSPDVLGRNSTFVVLRKYHSDVAAFRRFLEAHAETEEERELLAAKLVGRWRSGAPLTLAPEKDDPALGEDPQRNNDFTYAGDPVGRQVPLGSHMRRMNPRDTELAVLTDVDVHRIIRRSTTFGPAYDEESDDERGLYFIFMSARAMATIEFLQQEWVNRGNFVNLGDERDPMIGLHDEKGTFTIPKKPVRCRIHGIETFNRLRGGEYLFLPSLSGLRWLSELAETASAAGAG